MVRFHHGAFDCNVPIQPVVILSSNKYVRDAACMPPLHNFLLFCRLWTQFQNHLTIHFLPIVQPGPQQKEEVI